jgi:O-antigen ligase
MAMILQSQGQRILRNALYGFTLLTICSVTFSVAVSSIAMGISAALLLAYIFYRKELPKTGLEFFFLAYAAGELLATIFSSEQVDSFINMKRLFLIIIVYLILLSFNSRERLKNTLIIFVVVSSTLSFIELFSLTIVEGRMERLSIFQYFLTESGLKMMTLLLIIPFVFETGVPKQWKIGAIIVGMPLVLGLILTQTRSSWIGFIIGLVTIGLVKYKKVLLVTVALILLFTMIAPTDLKERALSVFDPQHTSNRSRINMITTGWQMFLDRPIVGFGDVDLKKYYVEYTVPIDNSEGGHLHNNIMHLLVTLGLLGFIAVMILFIKIFIRLYRFARNANDDWLLKGIAIGTFASYIAFHVNGLFEWNFGDHEVAVLLWFIVGISFTAYQTSDEQMAGANL